jgi:hypothetical protein
MADEESPEEIRIWSGQHLLSNYTACTSRMKRICQATCRTVGAAFLLSGLFLNAHGQAPGQPAGVNAALLKLFGETKAFTATVNVRLLDNARKETLRMTMKLAVLDGKVRAEVNMNDIQSADVPAATIVTLRTMGMDRVATVVQSERRLALLVYPTLSSYVEAPMSADEAASWTSTYQTRRTSLGKEKVEGQTCEKQRVVVTGERGDKHDALVWNASDLKGFPVQMEIRQKDAIVMMNFRSVDLQKPAASLFEPPAGFTRYETMDALVRSRTPNEKKK